MCRSAACRGRLRALPHWLHRGDLLYLPGHVLIYAGDGAVIHADGASMTVRRDSLAGLMRERGLTPASFTVRRPAPVQAG